jgi:hypothetical protein
MIWQGLDDKSKAQLQQDSGDQIQQEVRDPATTDSIPGWSIEARNECHIEADNYPHTGGKSVSIAGK